MIEFDIIPMPKPQNMRAHDGKKLHILKKNPGKFSQRERERLAYIQEYFYYCNSLAWLARQTKFTCPDVLSLVFVIPMPKSWSAKKKREMNGQPHQVKQRSDLSNLIKAFEDAVYKAFGKDDGLIYEYGKMRKEWGYIGKIQILK